MTPTVADRLAHLLETLVGPLPVRVRGWDGSEAGPIDAPVVSFGSRRAVRRLMWRPDELGLGRAFVAGELDIEGDLLGALERIEYITHRPNDNAGHVPGQRRELLRAAVSLGAVGPPPRPPVEEVGTLTGRLHSRQRDAEAISHHYDVGNDFYRLFLGETMVYSCAYWTSTAPDYGLDDAQRDKLDLVCRKLGLRPGMRLLDVGCGWGSMAMHAAEHYGVDVVGVTVAREQVELARKRVANAGLSDRVDIRLQDYRDVEDGPFDAISSIGMAEHVGADSYREYARRLYGLLRPGGRLLNHQIARRPGPAVGGQSFVDAYVFPDGELLPVGETVAKIEEAGFEVRDVESLREHYERTLRAWVGSLEAHWDEAVRLTTPGRARVWRLYMAGAALSFESAAIGVNQILAVKTHADGRSDLPPTREEWLGGGGHARR